MIADLPPLLPLAPVEVHALQMGVLIGALVLLARWWGYRRVAGFILALAVLAALSTYGESPVTRKPWYFLSALVTPLSIAYLTRRVQQRVWLTESDG